VANGSKLKVFYDRHTKFQKLQHIFIKALPMDRIDSCCYGKGTQKTELQKPFTADKIIDFLYKNGYVTLTLDRGAVTFTLKNNGFFSFRLGMAAVSSFAASIITTGVYASYELANRDDPDAKQKQEEMPMRVAALLSSAIPFTSLMSKLMDCCYKQEPNLFLALKNVVIQLYETKNNLHNMPYDFISLLKAFISPDYMDQNLEIIGQCRRYFDDIERNALKTKVSALESEVGTLKSKVATLETGVGDLKLADDDLEGRFEGRFKTLEEANKDASALLGTLTEQFDKESKQLAALTEECKRHSQLLEEEFSEESSLLSDPSLATDSRSRLTHSSGPA